MQNSEIYQGDAWTAFFNDGISNQTQVITGENKKSAIETFESQTGFVVDRAKSINKPQLICGCCGALFKGWQSPSHDTGYGTCDDCEKDEEDRVNKTLDSLVCKIERSLRPENLEIFSKKTQSQKRAFAMRCVEDGLVTYSF